MNTLISEITSTPPEEMLLDDLLVRTLVGSGHAGSAAAIIGDDGVTTRDQLFGVAGRLAHHFIENVTPDERVGLVDSRDANALIVVIASLMSGRSLAMLGVGEFTEDARELALRARCRLVVHGTEITRLGSAGFAGLESSPLTGICDSDPDEAMVLFTSGTTGQPKGVRLSRANVLANLTAMLRTALPWQSEDRLGQVLTTTHSFGLSMSLMALARSVPIVFLPDGPPSRSLAEGMGRHHVSIFACVPYFLRLMSRRGMDLGTSTAPDLRHLFLAGGGLVDEEIDQLLPGFDGALYLMYGFTETTARAAVRRYGDGAPSGSVGLPLPGTHIDIVDSKGSVLSVGEEGLIRATGPSLMIGYLGAPVRERGEHFTTSDLGHLDHAGNLMVTGREVEMMNFRGNRVSVVRLEAQAMRFDGVLDARAIPDSRAEDAQCLLRLILSASADESAVRRAVRTALEPRGIIRSVEVVHSLPKTRSGKAIRLTPADAPAGV
ncbi:Acyl-CoA synthetase (AMP-forming)/AMP-acid ligase II [Paramicrobacterium humi]|uniref:Acyl-CoA synthetase (AMP-forming)/AMP-acid ligase II n=1 Tax=Paramicrobacterium humi TaxID=640635 RepID=A0A1H4MMK0_9MICO|nr:class I adenylate-forming enzyme family protein [Microbacterium humi]SEB84209.1 Acyl-CoA synthetase (AMP-forming)/AMP-acid ligase II [Microbacterium humi]